MKSTSRWLLGSLIAVCGCSSSPTNPEGNAAIGVASFSQSETQNELDIVGRDADDNVVGTLRLMTGAFVMDEDGQPADGRRITVEIGGQQWGHESDGYLPLHLPTYAIPNGTMVNAFLLDPHVAPVLAARGVTILPPAPVKAHSVAPPTERPYDNNCTHGFQPTCGMTSCAEAPQWNPNDSSCTYTVTDEVVCCDSQKQVVFRLCDTAPFSNPCAPVGTNGCGNCGHYSYTSSCTAWVGDSAESGCFDGSGYDELETNELDYSID